MICIALALFSFLLYNANIRAIPAVDTYGARYLPLSIWQNRTLTLEPILDQVAQGRDTHPADPADFGDAFWIVQGRDDRPVSFYPVVVPIVVAPLYLPAVAYLDAVGWDPPRVDMTARVMEKLSASLLATASVALLYLLLRRRTGRTTALLLSAVYAFGTTTWVISSQALWMHGLGQLLVVVALWLLTGRRTTSRSVAAGMVCALIACNRQPDAVLAIALGLYGLWWAGRKAPLFVAGAAVPAGLLLFYNLAYVGNVFGAYALVDDERLREYFDTNPIEGFIGLLFSPTRGLFVFSPFLLFVPLCLHLVLRDRNTRTLTIACGAAVIVQIAGYGFGDWRQGVSWGPRWLTDMLPILIWMLPPVVAGLRGPGRALFAVACGVSIAIQAVGAFWYIGVSDAALFGDEGPDRTHAAWDWRNAPFIAELEHPPASADLLVPVRGNIDIAQIVADSPDGGLRLDVEGWALAGGQSPADVAVRVDGREVAGTRSFFDRTDVAAALGVSSPSGWRVSIPADDFAPGEHSVAALVRAGARGESRWLVQRTFTMDAEAARLAAAARRAGEWIAAQQQEAGFWLTTHTEGTSFDPAYNEMNTYTQALLIDILRPIAGKAGLAVPLERAERFLGGQIEDDGLVRYHGRPDGETIGRLGCVITPDADDTALAWRIAPDPSPEKRQSALTTMSAYRTPDGLYRTWLAPHDRYECIDPGSDPNPADIGIQASVLLWLDQVDPQAARALCASLRRRVDDDAVWVYYKLAPAILALRRSDLRRAGCSLELPPGRLETSVAGQASWMQAIALFQQLEDGQLSDASLADARRLLRTLAADDFSLLRRSPPVIYHNDLTATVSRLYWSTEVGLALWLRLYFATLEADAALCSTPDRNCGMAVR